jgi:hypothetical protein
MPYNINIDDYNFFSATETVENTMPFRLPQLLTWAKTKDSLPAEEITSVFDPKLAKVVIDNSTNFIREFLPKNIILNSDFSGDKSPFSDSNSNIKENDNKYYPTVTLSTAESSAAVDAAPYKGTLHSFPIKDVDGAISWIFGTTNLSETSVVSSANPLIIYRTGCTKNHLHFPGATGCTIKLSSGNKNKCECDGTPVLNNESHSHCFEFKPTSDINSGSPLPLVGGNFSYTNIFENAYYSYYKSQFDTSLRSDGSSGSGLSGSLNNPNVVSGDSDTANQNALELHKLVYDYYVEVYNNLNYKKRFNPTNPNELLMTDTMTKYNYNYLNMFNIISGIIIASGCIIMLRRG